MNQLSEAEQTAVLSREQHSMAVPMPGEVGAYLAREVAVHLYPILLKHLLDTKHDLTSLVNGKPIYVHCAISAVEYARIFCAQATQPWQEGGLYVGSE